MKVWIGLDELQVENSFKWTGGQPFTWESWATKNIEEGANCVAADQSGHWDWINVQCKEKKGFVCEHKIAGQQGTASWSFENVASINQ